MRLAKIAFIVCILFIFGCKKSPYSDTPHLNFLELVGPNENNELVAGGGNTLTFRIDFRDGDGNLGYPESDTTQNITLIDNRNNEITRFQFPDIPSDFNPKAGLQGTYEIFYQASFILKTNDTLSSEDVSWDIFITDQDGNQSNTITTSTITLI